MAHGALLVTFRVRGMGLVILKKKKKKNERNAGGVGNLDKVPYQIHEYTCCKCLKVFSFLSGFRCDCEKFHKFRAKPIIVTDVRFDSLREGGRYSKLLFLHTRGLIQDFTLYPTFPLVVEGTKIGVYEADFSYCYQGVKWVEDVKGKLTDVFQLKRKLFGALYPDENLVLTW